MMMIDNYRYRLRRHRIVTAVEAVLIAGTPMAVLAVLAVLFD